jgi:hypothetical protein
MHANGPISSDRPTELVAIVFALDPTIGVLEVNGSDLPVFQIVGITNDEYETARRWRSARLLSLLARGNPLWVTDLRRQSVLGGDTAREVQDSIENEGSSLRAHSASFTEVTEHGAQGVRLVLGAGHVTPLLESLAFRVGHGRTFEVYSPTAHVSFIPAEQARISRTGADLRIDVSPALLQELSSLLRPVRGVVHSFVLKGLSFQIEPTLIRTPDGAVVETIG